MGSTTVDAKGHFGQRILQLLGETGLSQTEAAEMAGMPLRTLQRWITLERPPNRATSRLTVGRLEKVLGAEIAPRESRQEGEEMLNERMWGYETGRRAQMIDFRQQALHATGRARHGIARAIERLIGRDADPAEIVRMLESADSEIAVSQRILMGKIEVNDKGDPV